MTRWFTLIAFAFLAFSFTYTDNPFRWLEGSWEMKKANGNCRLEIWSSLNDHEMTGKGISVKGVDSTLLENIQLVFKDNFYWYIPTVPDQNNAQPVSFKLVRSHGSNYTFENPDHDFPQRIVYHFKPVTDLNRPAVGDTLFVRVESLTGDGMDFHFLRK